jgi:AcrR family transcriptional regulator
MPKVSAEQLERRRRQILDGARQCFARYGFEGATVRTLEAETGLSRGAIFHHFRDKESLFLAVAEDDALEMATTVAEQGLVQVMRELRKADAPWLGTQLEVVRRMRTDPTFRRRWSARTARLSTAATERLVRQREAKVVRDDVPVETLVALLMLVLDGLVLHRAAGLPTEPLDAVLDLVETTVRAPGRRRRSAARD